MNKENASKLWKMIQEAGLYLHGQLPDHPNHPKGRNPYAHVAICVKEHFKKSLKDFPAASSSVFLNLSFGMIKPENNNNRKINPFIALI